MRMMFGLVAADNSWEIRTNKTVAKSGRRFRWSMSVSLSHVHGVIFINSSFANFTDSQPAFAIKELSFACV
jgi:hypothetical protein